MFWQTTIIRWILRCVPLIAILSVAPAYAQQGFENVVGSWSGGGIMTPSDGPRERVRCKADYVPKNNGQSVKLNLRCTSDANKPTCRATGLKASIVKAGGFRGKTSTA
jgi:hypothetical protein